MVDDGLERRVFELSCVLLSRPSVAEDLSVHGTDEDQHILTGAFSALVHELTLSVLGETD